MPFDPECDFLDTCECDQCQLDALRQRARRSTQVLWAVAAWGIVVLVALVLVTTLAGCASTPATPPVQPTPGQALEVQVADIDGPPLPGAVVTIQDNQNKGRTATANALGRALLSGLIVPSGQTVCAEAEGYVTSCVGVTLTASSNTTIRLGKVVVVPPAASIPFPVAGRIRATPGGFVNDLGPWRWAGISDFDLLHLARTGRKAEALARMDANAAYGFLTNLRVFATASILFDLGPDQPGYDEALTWLITEANRRGFYIDLVLFCDAQQRYPNHLDRQRALDRFADRLANEPGVIVELSNEPTFNGWTGALDPALLTLADRWKARVGHRDFFIGDPPDGDDLDASAKTVESQRTLASRVNLLALHSSRKGGADLDGARLRRHVDHLESGSDIRAAARRVNPNALLIHNEPMGAASIRFVPLPNGRTYERESDPDALVALVLTGLFTSDGITYHRIAQQNPGTPGLGELARIVATLPAAGCVYRNDSWTGAPSRGFSWNQKVRWLVCGDRAWGLGYGLDTAGTVNLVDGWRHVKTLYESPADETGPLARSKVAVFEVAR